MLSRCVTLSCIAVLATVTFLSPLAGAQDIVSPDFSLATTPGSREVVPGQNASYAITISNSGLLDRTARMSLTSQLPAGWTHSFSLDPVPVPSKANATTTLVVYVPADAQPQTFNVTYEANDSSGFARDTVSLTVKPQPAQPQPQTIGAPRLRLVPSAGDSGESGSMLRGTLTLENVDPARPTLTVTIALASSDGWTASIAASDATRVLDFGVPMQVPLAVEVPALTQDTSKELTITVSVEGTTFLAHWSVLGLAAAPASEGDEPAPASETASPEGRTGTTGTRVLSPTGPNLEVLVTPVEISVPANGEADAIVRLSNTGNTDLIVALSGSPPPSWSPILFEVTTVALAAGEIAEVPLTLFAPDVPPNGRAAGSISAQTASGIVRGADFVITVAPGAPRDETSAALIQAPVDPEGGLPGLGTTALVVVGLAAVGGAAAFVVNRPLREKLLWGAAGLYTRLARPDVLGHEDREKLYRLVETQPGIHFHALQRDLAWNTGTLTYHLRVLEKHGFMVSRRDGLYRRFYLAGTAPRKEVFENQGPTGLRADVMEAIRNQPGMSQSDLALGLGANKQTVNYHVKALERAGTIRVEKRGRDTFLYPAEPATATGSGLARV